MTLRTFEQIRKGRPTSDGAGVKLTRVIGADLHRRMDPFLMLDAFRNENPEDYIAGFPDHPHRGFETVTYMIAGRMRHRDSAGNEGLLLSGSAQWMVAGSGLIHSEIPEQEEGLMEGFQLWLNLPAQGKMCAPAYRDIPPSEIPEFNAEGIKVRVLAGEYAGVQGALQRPVTEPVYFDVHLKNGEVFEHPLDSKWNGLIYVYRGALENEGQILRDTQMGILDLGGDQLKLRATEDCKFLLIAGVPLKESIAAYGPFVMNTSEQIQQTFLDYEAGHFHRPQVQSL